MKNPFKTRGIPDIQREYNQTCAKLGHAEHNINVLKQETAELRKTLIKLSKEAARSKAASEQTKETK